MSVRRTRAEGVSKFMNTPQWSVSQVTSRARSREAMGSLGVALGSIKPRGWQMELGGHRPRATAEEGEMSARTDSKAERTNVGLMRMVSELK
ncbi:hypothetical protein HJFPF1_10143 [Paramyrothecium foliicola]|nr:hypothetical protein HJFPF1_10143 [Paramyrothecium foliicola]